MAWVLLNSYSKMQKERVQLKTECLSKKEPELEDLKNYQTIYIVKNEKACPEENTKGVTEQLFDEEIMGTTHELKKPVIEMGLYKQTLPIGAKRDRETKTK